MFLEAVRTIAALFFKKKKKVMLCIFAVYVGVNTVLLGTVVCFLSVIVADNKHKYGLCKNGNTYSI